MTDYTWQLGIDWYALPTAGLRYLRQRLVPNDTSAPLVPNLREGDRVTFIVLDVSPVLLGDRDAENTIKSFSILCKNSELGLGQVLSSPFDRLQLTFVKEEDRPSSVFSSDPLLKFPTWVPVQMVPVGSPPLPSQGPTSPDYLTVTKKGRYLVSFLLQAEKIDSSGTGNYIFAHDPEMIIGEHG